MTLLCPVLVFIVSVLYIAQSQHYSHQTNYCNLRLMDKYGRPDDLSTQSRLPCMMTVLACQL